MTSKWSTAPPLIRKSFFHNFFENFFSEAFRYLFGLIDVATNRLFIKAMTNRTAQAVTDYVRTIYDELEDLIKELQKENIQLRAHTDNGKEFLAAVLGKFFVN